MIVKTPGFLVFDDHEQAFFPNSYYFQMLSLYQCFFQLYAEKVATRGLCAIAQCESLRYKLIGGLAVRR